MSAVEGWSLFGCKIYRGLISAGCSCVLPANSWVQGQFGLHDWCGQFSWSAKDIPWLANYRCCYIGNTWFDEDIEWFSVNQLSSTSCSRNYHVVYDYETRFLVVFQCPLRKAAVIMCSLESESFWTETTTAVGGFITFSHDVWISKMMFIIFLMLGGAKEASFWNVFCLK